MTLEQRIHYLQRLRSKIKAAGSNGEYRDVDGTDANLQWIPREDSTQQQTDTALSIIAAYDAAADTAQILALDRAAALGALASLSGNGKVLRAVVLILMDELNLHAAKHNAILTAIDGAATFAAMKTAIAAIADYPTRTKAQLITAITNKVNAGEADA